MDLGLAGRGYLLTGASRGLGFATARALVDDGARVLISSRSADAVHSATAELGGPPDAFGTAADLADPAAAERLVSEARARPGPLRLIKALADELGPLGIRVFGLLPGRVATDRIAEIEAATGDAEAARARAEAAIPLRRVGRPEEFGKVAACALSPAASYLTGVTLPVDGGVPRSV